MPLSVAPHLNFRDRAREALEYYRSVFGGELMLATYGDIHAAEEPEQADRIAFGVLTAPDGLRLLGYDVQPSKDYDAGANPFYVALHGDDVGRVQAVWDALVADGTVLIDLAPSPFAPLYGMLTDRYGVTWIIDANPDQP